VESKSSRNAITFVGEVGALVKHGKDTSASVELFFTSAYIEESQHQATANTISSKDPEPRHKMGEHSAYQ